MSVFRWTAPTISSTYCSTVFAVSIPPPVKKPGKYRLFYVLYFFLQKLLKCVYLHIEIPIMMNKFKNNKKSLDFSGISPLRHITQNDFIGVSEPVIIVNGEGVYVDFKDGFPYVFKFLSYIYMLMGDFIPETLTREEREKLFEDLGYTYGSNFFNKISPFQPIDRLGSAFVRDCFGYSYLDFGDDEVIMSRDVYETYGNLVIQIYGGTLKEIEPIPQGLLDSRQIDFVVPTINPKAFKVLFDELLKQLLDESVNSVFSARTAPNTHLEKASALLQKMYNRMHSNNSSLKNLWLKEK